MSGSFDLSPSKWERKFLHFFCWLRTISKQMFVSLYSCANGTWTISHLQFGIYLKAYKSFCLSVFYIENVFLNLNMSCWWCPILAILCAVWLSHQCANLWRSLWFHFPCCFKRTLCFTPLRYHRLVVLVFAFKGSSKNRCLSACLQNSRVLCKAQV